MDKAILAELKAQLEQKKKTTIEQLQSIGSRSMDEGAENNFDAKFPDYGDSMEDSATEVADYTKNLSLERDLEKELEDVEKALAKIEDGTYGVCVHCGKDIEIERLKIRPESSSCVECKKRLKNQI